MSICSVATALLGEDSLSQLELMSHSLKDYSYKIIKSTETKLTFDIALNENENIFIPNAIVLDTSRFKLCRLLKQNPVIRVGGMKQGEDGLSNSNLYSQTVT